MDHFLLACDHSLEKFIILKEIRKMDWKMAWAKAGLLSPNEQEISQPPPAQFWFLFFFTSPAYTYTPH